MAVAAGVAAALGIALKPYFAGVWLMLVVVRSRHAGRILLAVEDLVIVSIGVAYVLAVAVLTPAYFPLVRLLAPAYSAYSPTPAAELFLGAPAVWCFLGAFVAWSVRKGFQIDPVGNALVAACLGSLLAVLMQGKGWFYHYYPLTSFSVLLGAWAVARPRSPTAGNLPRAARGLALGLLCITAAPTVIRALEVTTLRAGGEAYPRNHEVADLRRLLREQRGARSIEVLSTDITPTFPLVQVVGLTDDQPLPHLWLPTTVYRSRRAPGRPVPFHPRSAMKPAERAMFDVVVDGITRRPPDLLLVETMERNETRSGYPGGFDHLAYYAQDTGFARVLRSYRRIASSHGFDLLTRLKDAGVRP
jgi:hypothetical protein